MSSGGVTTPMSAHMVSIINLTETKLKYNVSYALLWLSTINLTREYRVLYYTNTQPDKRQDDRYMSDIKHV